MLHKGIHVRFVGRRVMRLFAINDGYSYTAPSVLPSVVLIPSPFFECLTIYNKLKIMKHILNNLSEEEKNSIREQHTGGMKVMTESFSKLLNSKLGDSKPLVSEKK